MKTHFSKLALTAGVLFAIAFTLGCEEKESAKSSSSADEGLSSAEVATATAPKEEAGGLVGTSGTFKDDRDGKSYKWVKIGTQTWMAENLSYNAEGSKCYENKESNCRIYGRLYFWGDVCPEGWHLPSDADWDVLMKSINSICSESTYGIITCKGAGTKLKATSGWNSNGNGTDDFGFAALPGGLSDPSDVEDFHFINAGYTGVWWSASDDNANRKYMTYNEEDVTDYNDRSNIHYNMYSIRCLQN